MRDPSDPAGERRLTLWIAKEAVDRLYKGPPGQLTKWHNLYTAIEVLQGPERIFGGLRDGEPEGLCFVGRPHVLRRTDGGVYPLPEGRVYVAYVDAARDLYDWRPEEADPSDPAAPIAYLDRFRELLWPPKT